MRVRRFSWPLALNAFFIVAVVYNVYRQTTVLHQSSEELRVAIEECSRRLEASESAVEALKAAATILSDAADISGRGRGGGGRGGGGGGAAAGGAGSGGGDDGGNQWPEVCYQLSPKTQLNRVELGQGGTVGHKLAVLIPYRDRERHLHAALPRLHKFLAGQGREFDVFVLEQTPRYRFNRGALLNAGVLLLRGSDYDYFAFQDVDTLPTEMGGIEYEYPEGPRPLHLTPPGVHPKVGYEDFFGGVTIFTPEQMEAVNGYGTNFWGWGKEDDNMRERLKSAGLWPPQRPNVPPARTRQFYFTHQAHYKAKEVRVKWVDGEARYYEVNPDRPLAGGTTVSSQGWFYNGTTTGLNTTRLRLAGIRPDGNATRLAIELYCDEQETPWCRLDATRPSS